MPTPQKHLKDLYRLITKTKSEKDVQLLLSDLLSPKELSAISERWQLVQMLYAGIPQRTIAKTLKMSISKVTRGSQALQKSRGGFIKFLPKKHLHKKKSKA